MAFAIGSPSIPPIPTRSNNGVLVFDPNPSFSLGGTALCIFFCKVGQLAYDGSQTVYATAYDQAKGQPGTLTVPGVWRLTVLADGSVQPTMQLVPRAGLAGNLPTSIALGPDGNLYVGFLKNGNVIRIVNPTAPRPVWADAMRFISPMVSPASIMSGITTDGINRLYMAINGAGVFRYTISSGTTQIVSTGGAGFPFAFVGGLSNLMNLDRLGNLWIGDDTSDGAFNFSGRIWYISAGSLSTIP